MKSWWLVAGGLWVLLAPAAAQMEDLRSEDPKRRAKAAEVTYGDADYHRERVAEAIGL